MIVIFNLGFGKCGLFDHRPHNGASRHGKAGRYRGICKISAQDLRFGFFGHCRVRVRPVRRTRRGAEILPIARLSIFRRRRGIRRGIVTSICCPYLYLARGIVPRSSIRSAIRGNPSPEYTAHHNQASVGLRTTISFENFIERSADMDIAIRIRRARHAE